MSAADSRPVRRPFAAIDFETFWDSKDGYSLTTLGPVEYIRDPRFEVQLLGLAGGDCFGSSSSSVWGTSDHVYGGSPWEGKSLGFQIHQTLWWLVNDPVFHHPVLVGHNISGFDGLILSEHYDLHPMRLHDTISMMHWTGLSRLGSCSHASLCSMLGTGEKQAGTVVSDGKRWERDFSFSERSFFAQYCRDDASQCRANYMRMFPYMTEDALRFIEITARMATSPAFVVDRQMVENYIAKLEKESAEALDSLCDALALPRNREAMQKAIRSSRVVASLLRRLGVEPPTKVSEQQTETRREQLSALAERMLSQGREAEAALLRQQMETDLPVVTYAFSKSDLEFRALLDHEDPRVRLLVETRLGYNSSMPLSRAKAFLAVAGERPVPIVLCAFKAHTSRYTAGVDEGRSDGLQFQNLGKRDPRVKALRKAIRAPEGYAVVACDSSQIEARMLAWLANETDLVEQFRQGRDPYAELAGKIFNMPSMEIHDGAKAGDQRLKTYRNVGKTAILSAGYGVGSDKFSRTLLLQGARLGDTDAAHETAAWLAWSTYRETNRAIVAFWKTCDYVLRMLLMGERGKFGGPDGAFFEYGPMTICDLPGPVPSIALPSGFILRYPGLREEERDDGYGSELVYDRPAPRGRTLRARIYSGLLANNLTQCAAFQLLMWQACRMDEAGIPLHANIHDSFASVVPEKYAEETKTKMEEIMGRTPPWASTCPIACEAEIGTDFGVV